MAAIFYNEGTFFIGQVRFNRFYNKVIREDPEFVN